MANYTTASTTNFCETDVIRKNCSCDFYKSSKDCLKFFATFLRFPFFMLIWFQVKYWGTFQIQNDGKTVH